MLSCLVNFAASLLLENVYLLQTARAHCNALHHTQHTATHCNTLQHTATCCITVQHTATHCTLRYRKLQYTLHELNQRQLSAVCPHTADILKTYCRHAESAHCKALPHTATHCHTLQIYCMRCSMSTYGVVTIRRLLKIIGLFCKKAL